ncbi:MAG: hypothetical protein C0500_02710 [Sphingobium sp.]|nr:hypothetical protein [Sphingobium sp.]
MNRGGLCDVCVKPGNCCRDVFLENGGGLDALESPMSFERAEHLAMSYSLPFRPARQRADGRWTWWCTALDDRSGRCTRYAARPQLCRDYAPGTDELCAHYVAAHESEHRP